MTKIFVNKQTHIHDKWEKNKKPSLEIYDKAEAKLTYENKNECRYYTALLLKYISIFISATGNFWIVARACTFFEGMNFSFNITRD